MHLGKPSGRDWKIALRHWKFHGRGDLIEKASESKYVSSKTRRLAENALIDLHVREKLELINDKKRFADYRRQIDAARPKAKPVSALHESQLANEARLRRERDIEEQRLFRARQSVAQQQAKQERLLRLHSRI